MIVRIYRLKWSIVRENSHYRTRPSAPLHAKYVHKDVYLSKNSCYHLHKFAGLMIRIGG